jgi:hypothetical protein
MHIKRWILLPYFLSNDSGTGEGAASKFLPRSRIKMMLIRNTVKNLTDAMMLDSILSKTKFREFTEWISANSICAMTTVLLSMAYEYCSFSCSRSVVAFTVLSKLATKP